jgi:hypothetical protein
MQLTGTKRLRDGRQMLPAGGYSEPTENQGIMDMETGEIIALSKKDQRIAEAKKNRKEVMAKLQAKVDKENEQMKAKVEDPDRVNNDRSNTVKEWASSLLQGAKVYPKSDARKYLDALKDGITGKDKDNDRTFLNKPGTPIPDYLMPDDLVGWISQESLARGKRYNPDNAFTFKWDGKKIVVNE